MGERIEISFKRFVVESVRWIEEELITRYPLGEFKSVDKING